MLKAKGLLLLCVLTLIGCQTVQEKNLELVKDRSTKLQPLSHWSPTWCRVETRLTQPAVARYRALFPDEAEKLSEETWAYTWKSRQSGCEVTSLEPSPMIKNHQVFVENALCTLLQVHWVNSPFAGLQFSPDDVVKEGQRVQIRTSTEPGLGVFLDPESFNIQTHTKNRGVFTAVYSERGPLWVPTSIQQTSGSSVLRVDSIEYNDALLNGRPSIRAFWISVGEAAPIQHTQVILSECKNY